MIHNVAELKGLLDFIYELQHAGKNPSQIRLEVQNRYKLTLTDSQFQGLIRVVGSEITGVR